MSKNDDPVIEWTNLPHIAARVFNTPLMISRPKLEIILSVLGPRFNLDVPQLSSAAGAALAAHREFQLLASGVAVIPVLGSLVHRTMGIDALSGLTSYTEISKQFAEAVESPQVRAIAFDMGTPGGESSAVFDLSDQIFNARGSKPIIAIANEQMYSSGYAIGSAADEIYVSRTAGVGSIGVIAAHVDESERDKMQGRKITTVFAGERKNDFNPHEELNSEALQILQEHVNTVYGMFVETVARNRGMSTKAVRDTQAGFFIGKSAVRAKLADDVMSASEAFEKTATKRRRLTMSTNKPVVAGANLVKFLSHSIDAVASSEKTRDEVIGEMASSAGADASAINALLDGCKSAPDLSMLTGFSTALNVSMDDMLAAAKADGFEYKSPPVNTDKQSPPVGVAASNVIDIDKAREEGKKAAMIEYQVTAKAINEMCVLANMQSLSGDMIARQLTVDQARTELFNKKASMSDGTSITSNVDGMSNGLPSVSASWDAAFKKAKT